MDRGVVSIRFRHPTRELAFLSEVLGLTAFRTWKVGTPKETPTGQKTGGVYDISYWVSRIEFEPKAGFSVPLTDAIGLLQRAEATVRELLDTGGNLEIYLHLTGWLSNSGSISAALLRTMADLGVRLSIEVFPD